MYFCFFCLCVFLVALIPLFLEYTMLKSNSFLSHFSSLLCHLFLLCQHTSPLSSYLFLKSSMSLYLSFLILFRFIKLSSLLSPSYRYTIAPSHRHAITPLPLLKLAVTQLLHLCSSSPAHRHLKFATAHRPFATACLHFSQWRGRRFKKKKKERREGIKKEEKMTKKKKRTAALGRNDGDWP